MGKYIIHFIFTLVGSSVALLWLPTVWELLSMKHGLFEKDITNIVIGGIFGLLCSFLLSNKIIAILESVEKFLDNKSPLYLLFGSIGAIVGLVIGTLLSIIFNYIQIPGVSDILPVVLIVSFGYLGFRVGTRRPDNWKKVAQQLKPQQVETEILQRREGDTFYRHKVLDTSVIIDGRIADIVDTGFLEGTLVVPLFVVHELQYIADSADSLKRAKGRRGLDILNRLQKSESITVDIYEGDFEDIPEVDSKLVKLAKVLEGTVLTNDYNLNKVCEFQNVKVLNVNELANAIKPVVLPGEEMTVLIVKDGSERQQGIAYMEDGTMIVVEDGKHYMNEQLDVVVTSALQTAAGRMVFAKPIHSQRKIKEHHKG
ncbi:PIN domain nuclease [Granulicatella sp. zg-ZJ]|uniref:PIN/TRAM domain-containing protein n=1 Tax=unclassified Granulicatella TaxID=2630493 RepID=UPI0013C28F6D|nr:PIN domain nuclease [Granulicatella sp. zg-ZJ]NEW66557.1 PIN domain nuclease [Granulicatella sp. zg-84]QMI86701.1 PIN/TRAM domain-containing protein [Carnobacteriaceae bacterium zg-84]